MTNTAAWLKRALELLSESLDHWEGEENSVQEEKADHISNLNAFFNAWQEQTHLPPPPLEYEDEE
jgi:hypothetical protein